MMLPVFWILLLVPLASAGLIIQQEFVSSQQVSLLFSISTSSVESDDEQTISLWPHDPKTKTITLNDFTPVFHFSIQLVSQLTDEPEGHRIFRRVEVTPNQPWINDTFTTPSGVSVSVATKFMCTKTFSGPRCEQECDEHAAKAVRKRCDSTGRLRCDVGWSGPHCSQPVDPRKCNCHNGGACVSSFLHGTNSSDQERFVCECPTGFSGEKCEIPPYWQFQYTAPNKDACSMKDACLNGAQCFPNGPKIFCACPVGFIGKFCETSLSSTVSPSIELSSSSSPSSYSVTIYTLAAVFLFLLLAAACFTYKIKPRRENALSRGQEPSPFVMPESKTMLIDQKQKVFTIEDGLQARIDDERYTSAPKKTSSEYAVIEKKKNSTPPPPAFHPPPIPDFV